LAVNARRWAIIAVAIGAVVLLLREFGYVELTYARCPSGFSTSQDTSWDASASPSLTAEDTKLTKIRREVTFGGILVYYDETWDFPWARWVPLVKGGESSVTRNYFATSSGAKIFIGNYTSKISFSAYGFLSARGYAAFVAENDRKSFLRQIEKRVRTQPNKSPEPTAPSGRGSS